MIWNHPEPPPHRRGGAMLSPGSQQMLRGSRPLSLSIIDAEINDYKQRMPMDKCGEWVDECSWTPTPTPTPTPFTKDILDPKDNSMLPPKVTPKETDYKAWDPDDLPPEPERTPVPLPTATPTPTPTPIKVLRGFTPRLANATEIPTPTPQPTDAYGEPIPEPSATSEPVAPIDEPEDSGIDTPTGDTPTGDASTGVSPTPTAAIEGSSPKAVTTEGPRLPTSRSTATPLPTPTPWQPGPRGVPEVLSSENSGNITVTGKAVYIRPKHTLLTDRGRFDSIPERHEIREEGFIAGYELGYDNGLWEAYKNFTDLAWDPFLATIMDSMIRPLPQPDDIGPLMPWDPEIKLDRVPGEGELPGEEEDMDAVV